MFMEASPQAVTVCDKARSISPIILARGGGGIVCHNRVVRLMPEIPRRLWGQWMGEKDIINTSMSLPVKDQKWCQWHSRTLLISIINNRDWWNLRASAFLDFIQKWRWCMDGALLVSSPPQLSTGREEGYFGGICLPKQANGTPNSQWDQCV